MLAKKEDIPGQAVQAEEASSWSATMRVLCRILEKVEYVVLSYGGERISPSRLVMGFEDAGYWVDKAVEVLLVPEGVMGQGVSMLLSNLCRLASSCR